MGRANRFSEMCAVHCIVVVKAQMKSISPNAAERMSAIRLGRIAITLSVVGIVVGVIVISVTIWWRLSIDYQYLHNHH